MLTFAEELILLLHDEDGAPLPIQEDALACALAGAVLMDLAFAYRIDTDLQALVVIDQTPTGNPALDRTLAKVATRPEAADMLYLVMSSDRAVYARKVVQRLTRDDQVLTASEHFEDDSALPLPAQMFRFGAELAADKTDDFFYSLLSLHPVNKKNGPGTDLEQQGLQFVADNPGENFYGEEELGGERYFAAVYPDVAVAEACVNCHKDSPRTDVEVGDVMGGVVIRIPMD